MKRLDNKRPRFAVGTVVLVLLLPISASANWGDAWGEMLWGTATAVPSISPGGLVALAAVLAIAAGMVSARRNRRARARADDSGSYMERYEENQIRTVRED